MPSLRGIFPSPVLTYHQNMNPDNEERMTRAIEARATMTARLTEALELLIEAMPAT